MPFTQKKYAVSSYLDIPNLSVTDLGFFESNIPEELVDGLNPIAYGGNIHWAKGYKNLFTLILIGLKGIHSLACHDPKCPITRVHFHCSCCHAPVSLAHFNTYNDLVNRPLMCDWCGQPFNYPPIVAGAVANIQRRVAQANKEQEDAADEATLEELDAENAKRNGGDEDNNSDEGNTSTDQDVADGVWRNGAFFPFDGDSPIGYDPNHENSSMFGKYYGY